MKYIFLLLFCVFWFSQAYSQCADLFFSEYIEGSSSNKALEIYNPTSNTVDLTNYVVYRYNNGSQTATDSLFPQGMLGSLGVFIVANPSANAAIQAEADTTHSMTFYNGDDAISLINKTTDDTLDIIGEIGVDPGSGWTVGTGATNNHTLIRKKTIQKGQTGWSISVTEWDVFFIDMVDSLGAHIATGCFPAGPGCTDDLFFSEYIEGSSSNKAFEIYNPTDNTADLTNYVVYRYNNGSLTPTDSLFPQGLLLSDSIFVVANPSANAAIQAEADTTHTMTFYNGDDAISLINKSTGDTLDIIGQIGVDPGSGWTVGTGATNNHTLIRKKTIQKGQTDWSISVTEWDVFLIDMFDSLGTHTMISCGIKPIVSFSGDGITVDEFVGSIDVEVTIQNPNFNDSTAVDVVLNIASSATNGSDFTLTTPQTLVFSAGSEIPIIVNIPITDDTLVENQETIVLELKDPTTGASINFGEYTILVDDNDFPTYPIGSITTVDGNGVVDSLAVKCWIHGVVYGFNLRPSGTEFILIDTTGGIQIFDFGVVSGYSPTEADSVAVLGTVGQFSGLANFDPDSIIVFNSGNTLKTPVVVAILDESTESDLVKLECWTIIDTTQWSGMGSGFNVDITNGLDTAELHVDADTDLFGTPVPVGTLTITGLGRQFDSSNPYNDGYLLQPRYSADITTSVICGFGPCTDSIAIDSTFLAVDPHQSEFRASSNLSAKGIVTSNNMEALSFKSGGNVDLLPEFEVELGAQLSIRIEDCLSAGFNQHTRVPRLKSRNQH